MDTVTINSDPPWHITSPHIDTSISTYITKQDPPHIIKAHALDTIEHCKRCLAIYTDGSEGRSGRVTSALYVPELNVKMAKRITDNLTVYTAELIAIKLRLEWINENDHDGAFSENVDVALFSDSLSSLISIQNGQSKTRPNLTGEILSLATKLSNKKII